MELLFDTMVREAETGFGELSSRLDQLGTHLEGRRNGKTRARLLGALILSLLFLCAYVALFLFLRSRTYPLLGTAVIVCSALLILAMAADELIQIRYYGTILQYRDRVTLLKNRVALGRSAIRENMSRYQHSETSGWDLDLRAGSSISEEADSIENKLSRIHALSGSFLRQAKTVLYFLVSALWTVFVPLAAPSLILELLYKAYEKGLIRELPGELPDLSLDEASAALAEAFATVPIWGIVAVLAVACIVELFLARLVWAKTNCEVTNVTALMTYSGPFVLVVGAVLLSLVITVLTYALIVIGIIFVCIIAYAIISGIFTGG